MGNSKRKWDSSSHSVFKKISKPPEKSRLLKYYKTRYLLFSITTTIQYTQLITSTPDYYIILYKSCNRKRIKNYEDVEQVRHFQKERRKYQAAISPPGGVASVDAAPAPVPSAYSYELQPSDSLLAFFYPDLSDIFWIANTISLMASLSVIFLYVSGFSLKRHIQIWVIRMAMWITLSSMTVAYVCAVIATTPTTDFGKVSNTLTALIIAMIAWVGLLILCLLALAVRFVRYLFTNKNKSHVPSKQENTSEVEIAAHVV